MLSGISRCNLVIPGITRYIPGISNSTPWMFPQNTLPADVQSNEEKSWLDFHGQETAKEGRLDLGAKKGSQSTSGASNDNYYYMWLDRFLTNMCACMLSHFRSIWVFTTLWTVAHQAPLSPGLSRQESWNGLPCPHPGNLPDPGI